MYIEMSDQDIHFIVSALLATDRLAGSQSCRDHEVPRTLSGSSRSCYGQDVLSGPRLCIYISLSLSLSVYMYILI